MDRIVLKICFTSGIAAALLVFVVGYFQAPVANVNPVASAERVDEIAREVGADHRSMASGIGQPMNKYDAIIGKVMGYEPPEASPIVRRDLEQARPDWYADVEARLNKMRAEHAAANSATTGKRAKGLAASGRDQRDIVALSSRQPSDGLTEEKLNTEFMVGVGKWTVERIHAREMGRQKLHGGAAGQPMIPEVGIIEAGGRRFGVVRIRTQGFLPIATIVGIDGADFVRVHCVSRTLQDVAITYGPCGEKIRETFGTSIAG